MIVVDSSALVAIVFNEPDAGRLLAPLRENHAAITTASLVEASIVVEARHGLDGGRDLDRLIELRINTFIDVDRAVARAAVSAWRRFGKGRHPASLDFGDCFSYAAASLTASPLLFIGNHFAQTDIASVL